MKDEDASPNAGGALRVTPLTREKRRELTRTTLLDAASIVFARQGFHAATLEEIAEIAGFTRGAIYSNFKDKSDLFLAVFERHQHTVLGELTAVLDDLPVEDLDKVSETVAAAWLGLLQRDQEWAMLRAEFWLFALRNPEAGERLRTYMRHATARATAAFEDWAKRAGVTLQIPAEVLARITMAVNDGLVEQHHADPDADYERLFREFITLFRGAVA